MNTRAALNAVPAEIVLDPEVQVGVAASPADLLAAHWRRTVARHPITDRQVWAVLVDQDGPLPVGPRLTSLPEFPDGSESQVLMRALAGALGAPEEGCSVGLMLARPGGPGAGSDEAWLAHLQVLASVHGVPLQPMFLASDAGVEMAHRWTWSASAA